jgi:hypothetical protein
MIANYSCYVRCCIDFCVLYNNTSKIRRHIVKMLLIQLFTRLSLTESLQSERWQMLRMHATSIDTLPLA